MPSVRNPYSGFLLLAIGLILALACGGKEEGRSMCGNLRIEGPEVCDGTYLGGATCEDEGFLGGTLACAEDCLSFDTSDCLASCPDGQHECDNECVDDDSPDSCGSSCEPCPTDPNGEAVCEDGECGIECDTGYLLCEEQCAECPSEGTDYVCDDDECVAASCGDGVCEGTESCASCPADCGECLPENIRLANGNTVYEGVLVVQYADLWLGVCDDGWGQVQTNVVCQELFGPGYVGTYRSTSVPVDDFWLDDVYCDGTEASLFDCSHNGWGSHNCSGSEHLWITCTDNSAPPGYGIRLTGGATATQGVLEVANSEEWRGVCDDGWGQPETDVVCRELFGASYTGTYSISYITTSSEFWLDDVSCTGTETSLADCTHDGWGSHNCGSTEHIWITCTDNSAPAGYGIRLTGGTAATEGVLEVANSGEWRGVCDDLWGQPETDVVCRELFGASYTGTYSISYSTTSSEFWLDDVDCTGTETSLEQCSHSGWGSHNCSSGEHIWITCADNSAPAGFDIRLTGGSVATEGVLEVAYSGEWRGVCDDGWGAEETLVACRELFGASATGTYSIAYSGSNSTFWLDNVSCTGTESSISVCNHNDWGDHNCVSGEHVWLSCTP